MAIIDIFILTLLAILWGYLKRRMHRHSHRADQRRAPSPMARPTGGNVDLVSHSLAHHRHRCWQMARGRQRRYDVSELDRPFSGSNHADIWIHP